MKLFLMTLYRFFVTIWEKLGIYNRYFIVLFFKFHNRKLRFRQDWHKNFVFEMDKYINSNFHQNLYENVDLESKKELDIIFYKLNLIKYVDFILYNSLFLPEELSLQKEIKKRLKKVVVRLWKEHIDESVMYYKHGINDIPNIYNLVKWKSILDCWAFIWDSAMMFINNLSFDKCYCFEPEDKNHELLLKTKSINKADNIIPIKMWIGKKCETLKINPIGASSYLSNEWNQEIEITSIDSFVRNNDINVWLIKRDIEWLEYDSLLWSKFTISKFKPILLISIYHNARDFFEIKSLIESWKLWYKFKIRKLWSTDPLVDTMLLCYI